MTVKINRPDRPSTKTIQVYLSRLSFVKVDPNVQSIKPDTLKDPQCSLDIN